MKYKQTENTKKDLNSIGKQNFDLLTESLLFIQQQLWVREDNFYSKYCFNNDNNDILRTFCLHTPFTIYVKL